MRGIMAKPTQSKSKKEFQSSIIEVPIYSSFREGLNVSEFFISTHGVRKGLTDTALKTAEAGYLTRRLVDVVQGIVITEEDCGTDRGYIVSDIIDRKDNNVIEHLRDRIVGRFTRESILVPNSKKVLVDADTYITEDLATAIVDAGIKSVSIRNAFTCDCKSGLCRKCYGKNNATDRIVENGESVGIMAAQSIGEPGTQLTMRTFHLGGVASGDDGDITQGLPRVEELFEARTPQHLAVQSKITGTITEISTEQGNSKIVVSNATESIEHKTSHNQHIRSWLTIGSVVEAGDKLTEGQISPKKLLEIAGVQAVQDYMIKEVKKVYATQGIDISDKHIEVVIKQMLNKVVVLEANDTNLIVGQTLSVSKMRAINQEAILSGKTPALVGPILLGITKASVETDSFLSAASFQETTKVLTNAAINGMVDHLEGLKENVIIGGMIPAGTGSPFNRESTILINERAEQLRQERIERNRKEEELPEEVTRISRRKEPLADL